MWGAFAARCASPPSCPSLRLPPRREAVSAIRKSAERWETGTNPRKSSSALTSHFLVYDQTLRVRFFTTCHGSFLRHCKVLVYASLFSIPPSVADWGFQRPCAEWDLCQFPTSRAGSNFAGGTCVLLCSESAIGILPRYSQMRHVRRSFSGTSR